MQTPLRALVLVALLGCRSTTVVALDDVAAIRATLEELYAAFCFDAGGEPDWETQRRIYLEGATFVAPIRPDRSPVGVDTDAFVSDFREFAREGSYSATGLSERIVEMRIEVHGGVAHAFVLFEGHVPPAPEAVTRGLDSIQLVRAGEEWRLVSFTTQYETPEIPIAFDG